MNETWKWPPPPCYYVYGLSLNYILDLFLKYNLDPDLIESKLLNSRFINEGFDKFWKYYDK